MMKSAHVSLLSGRMSRGRNPGRIVLKHMGVFTFRSKNTAKAWQI